MVALESVIVPPLPEGLVIGKLKGNYGVNLLGEVLIEPLGLGMLGAYMAWVASQVLMSEELGKLKGQKEDCLNRANKEPGIHGQLKKVNRVMTGRQANNARYCILKVTRCQYLELGKNVPLGQAEPPKWSPPKGAGSDFHSTGPRDMAAPRISSLSGRSSRELREKRHQLEGKLEHLSPDEKLTLSPVIEEYLDLFCNKETGVLPSTTKGRHEIQTGNALPNKKNLYRVTYALRGEMKR
jgi:hypothetical protein